MAEMLRQPLTRLDLDQMRCTNPNCALADDPDHELKIGPSCHKGAPSITCYSKAAGEVVIRYAACENIVARVLVAPGVLQ